MSEESMLSPEETPDTGNPEPNSEQGQWLWGSDVPGTGEAPEWLKADKYGSVADQAKAYTDLEKKFGSFTGAPEEYEVPDAEHFAKDIDLPEGVEFNLDKDDPLLQSFSAKAKEMGISQDGFNNLVGLYIQQQANDYAEHMTSAADQKAALGENADQRLGNISKWAQANMDKDMYGKLYNSLTTSEAVEAVEFLIGKARNSTLPNPGDITPRPAVSKQEYDQEMGKKDPNTGELLYITDPAHRAKVERMGQQLFGTEPNRQVMG